MLWRVPTPGFKGEQGGGSVAADALRAGKAMVDVWRTARLAPAAGTDHDPEDFLAMTWWDISTKRVIPVFDERVPRWRCKAVQCDYAGDQTVFSRAVLFGLPYNDPDVIIFSVLLLFSPFYYYFLRSRRSLLPNAAIPCPRA